MRDKKNDKINEDKLDDKKQNAKAIRDWSVLKRRTVSLDFWLSFLLSTWKFIVSKCIVRFENKMDNLARLTWQKIDAFVWKFLSSSYQFFVYYKIIEDSFTWERGKLCKNGSHIDLPHVEVADDYPGIHFRIVTAKILSFGGILPVENSAIQHWRVSTAFYVWVKLCSSEVPFGVVSHKTWRNC